MAQEHAGKPALPTISHFLLEGLENSEFFSEFFSELFYIHQRKKTLKKNSEFFLENLFLLF
jgi:hypothetical protein